MNLNKVMLAGNITRDIELKYIPSGSAVATLNLAVNRVWYKDEEKKEEVCYIKVVVWGKQAEACNEYLHKGSPVFIEGRLQFRSWETDDGQKRSVLEVVAERVQFLGSKQENKPTTAPAEPGPDQDNSVPF